MAVNEFVWQVPKHNVAKRSKIGIHSKLSIVCLLWILSSIFFAVNVFAFLALIMLSILIMISTTQCMGNKLFLLVVSSVLFSGVSIIGIRIYDIGCLLFLLYYIIKSSNKTIIPIKSIPFLLVVILNVLIHFSNGNSVVVEAIRYIICLILLVVAANLKYDFAKLHKQILLISVASIYFAFVMYLLMRHGIAHNYSSGIVVTNLFFHTKEIRFNGFFSDPNKFMAFAFALIFIIESFTKKMRRKRLVIFLLLVAAIMSLSRTALLVATCYIIFKLLRYIYDKNKSLFNFVVGIMIISVLVLLVFPDILLAFIDELYGFMAAILHREWTNSLGSSVAEDSRVYIWKQSINLIQSNLLFGYGWQSNEFLLPYPTHNTVFAILLDGGIIALVLYLVMISPLLNKKYLLWGIPLIILPAMMLDLQNYRILFFILGIAISFERTQKYTSKHG